MLAPLLWFSGCLRSDKLMLASNDALTKMCFMSIRAPNRLYFRSVTKRSHHSSEPDYKKSQSEPNKQLHVRLQHIYAVGLYTHPRVAHSAEVGPLKCKNPNPSNGSGRSNPHIVTLELKAAKSSCSCLSNNNRN